MGPVKNQKSPRFVRNVPQNGRKLCVNLEKNAGKARHFSAFWQVLSYQSPPSQWHFYSASKVENWVTGHNGSLLFDSVNTIIKLLLAFFVFEYEIIF